MNKKTYQSLIVVSSVLLFGIVLPVFALEIDWPELGGLKLTENSDISETTRYFFAFGTVVGTGIMFLAAMKAGFELLTGNGSPSVFQGAKNRLLGSVVGMVILLGTYVIIQEINPRINTAPESQCVFGIERKLRLVKVSEKTGKEKEYIYTNCIQGQNPDITLKEGEELMEETTRLGKCKVREVIVYSDKDYKGEKEVVFLDDNISNENCPDVPEISLEGKQSVRIIPKLDGAYLYDDELIGGGGEGERLTYQMSPYHVKDSVFNFNELRINDKIDKIRFAMSRLKLDGEDIGNGNKDFGFVNGAIIFSEPQLRGKCMAISAIHADIVKIDKATEKELDMRDNISSMIYYESPYTQGSIVGMGHITLYAVPDCQEYDKSKLKDSVELGRYDTCDIRISPGADKLHELERLIHDYGKGGNNNGECTINFLKDKYKKRAKENGGKGESDFEYFPVQSIRINGSAGVVLKSDSGDCHYYDLKESERKGNCITNLQDVYSSWKGGEKPKTIMVVPLIQKK
ncbi:hypothetical protein [Minisyncoccus archaeiphilus]|uniref:hypothetical protein n=1 Tax=Minisyncoccus archaeiphilus TaxID=3238481 RepID=UPI00399CC367